MHVVVNFSIYIDFFLSYFRFERFKFIFQEASRPILVLFLLEAIEIWLLSYEIVYSWFLSGFGVGCIAKSEALFILKAA